MVGAMSELGIRMLACGDDGQVFYLCGVWYGVLVVAEGCELFLWSIHGGWRESGYREYVSVFPRWTSGEKKR
jgi:hypothetical protein